MTYRLPEEIAAAKRNDPIEQFRQRVIEASLLYAGDLDRTDREVAAEVERCLIVAKAAPMPGEADLLTDVYVSY
jgi:pyruvate dehydrogenase E1 component alpha subunit